MVPHQSTSLPQRVGAAFAPRAEEADELGALPALRLRRSSRIGEVVGEREVLERDERRDLRAVQRREELVVRRDPGGIGHVGVERRARGIDARPLDREAIGVLPGRHEQRDVLVDVRERVGAAFVGVVAVLDLAGRLHPDPPVGVGQALLDLEACARGAPHEGRRERHDRGLVGPELARRGALAAPLRASRGHAKSKAAHASSHAPSATDAVLPLGLRA